MVIISHNYESVVIRLGRFRQLASCWMPRESLLGRWTCPPRFEPLAKLIIGCSSTTFHLNGLRKLVRHFKTEPTETVAFCFGIPEDTVSSSPFILCQLARWRGLKKPPPQKLAAAATNHLRKIFGTPLHNCTDWDEKFTAKNWPFSLLS
jgi:hypothetical protein